VVGAAGANHMRPLLEPGGGGGGVATVTAPQPVIVDTDVEDDPAGEGAYAPPAPRRARRRMWPMVVATLGVIAAGLGVGGWYAAQWINEQFYVGADKDEIVVYQGIDAELGPFQLFSVRHRSKLAVSALPAAQQSMVRDGITVPSLAAGVAEINKLKEVSQAARQGDDAESGAAQDEAEARSQDDARSDQRDETRNTDEQTANGNGTGKGANRKNTTDETDAETQPPTTPTRRASG